MAKADLHVHSWHSTESGGLRFLQSRDCYSDPVAVYKTAKARGMDYVSLTDHDSISGCLELRSRGYEDVIVGEEVSCILPDTDIEVHFGVYGITEELHRELQPLRKNALEVAACLRRHDVFFSLNHFLHFYRRHVSLEQYFNLLAVVPALEVRNGAMLAIHNELLQRIQACAVGWPRLALTAGSDAHTLRRIGHTWTEAPGDSTAAFLASLRAGDGTPAGRHGSARTVAVDTYAVISSYMASLVGVGPQHHTPARRTMCLGFCLLSLPFQFLPIVLLHHAKRREARTSADVVEYLRPLWDGVSVPAAPRESPI